LVGQTAEWMTRTSRGERWAAGEGTRVQRRATRQTYTAGRRKTKRKIAGNRNRTGVGHRECKRRRESVQRFAACFSDERAVLCGWRTTCGIADWRENESSISNRIVIAAHDRNGNFLCRPRVPHAISWPCALGATSSSCSEFCVFSVRRAPSFDVSLSAKPFLLVLILH
jgi:hypothetical protein